MTSSHEPRVSRSAAGSAHTRRMKRRSASGPSAPAGLAVTSRTDSSISLSWMAPPGPIAGYRVWEGAMIVATIATTSATIGGLEPRTPHVYTVTAYNATGESVRAAVVGASTAGAGWE
jgi:hypothetical protein